MKRLMGIANSKKRLNLYTLRATNNREVFEVENLTYSQLYLKRKSSKI